MRFFTFIIFLLLSLKAIAQEDLIIITEFKTTVTDDQVGVSFTLGKGSFCYGAQLERTTDTLNQSNFQHIGEITGVCGHQDFEVTYTLWDENPVANQKVYYRVITGFIPTGFVPVEFNDFGSQNHHLSPNPWFDQTKISVSNKQQKSVEIILYDRSGRFLFQKHLGNSEDVWLERNGLSAGFYVYHLLVDGQITATGTTVIQ